MASAQEIPADADAYAYSDLISLRLLEEEGLLTSAGGQSVGEILEVLEAEQAWRNAGNNNQTADISQIEIELLQALRLEIGSLQVPLLSATGNALLNGDLGALSAYAHAPADVNAVASVGAVGADGALDLGDGGNGGNASLNLSTLLGDTVDISDLVSAQLELGAVSSHSEKDGTDVVRDYRIADAKVVIDSPLVEDVVGSLQNVVGGLDTTLESLLGASGVLSQITNLIGTLSLGAVRADVVVDVPVDEIVANIVEDELADTSGLVSINLQTGEISVDLEMLHGGNLNGQDPNTPLLTSAQITQITGTVTSLLTASPAENQNGLIARVQNILQGDQETNTGGLYSTEVQLNINLLGEVAGLGLRTTLGGLLNPDAERTTNEATYDANKSEYIYQTGTGLGHLLTQVLGLVTEITGLLGGALEGILFDTGSTVLSGALNALDPLLVEILEDLNPLLTDVLTPILGITINRQDEIGGLHRVSALEVNVLSGLVLLPLANSYVSALDESEDPTIPGTTEPGTTEPGTTIPGTTEPSTTPTTPGGSTDGDDFISGSSAFLEKCMASPVGAITGLLAVLGTAAAIGGPAIDPLVKAIGGQLDAQLRVLSSNVGPDQPEWVQGINKGLNDAANAIDSRMVAAALFATALGALVAAPALCEDEGSSGSSI